MDTKVKQDVNHGNTARRSIKATKENTSEARLYRWNGDSVPVVPKNGRDFKLGELYKLLEVKMIEILNLPDGRIIICDEEGKMNASGGMDQFNTYASDIYMRELNGDFIAGNVIICPSRMLR